MKKVKLIISFFLISLCLIMTGEMFQNYIANFTDQFTYFDVSESDVEIRKEICSTIERLAKENGVFVFAAHKTSETSYFYSRTVYADEETLKTLQSKYDVHAGEYGSIFSGSTVIKTADYSEIAENKTVERFYFSGNSVTVQGIRDLVNTRFTASYIHTEKANANRWLIVCVWLLSGLLVLLMTWFDIQFQKKENFVQISLGRPRLQIILKNALTDTLAYLGIYLVLYLLLGRYTYLGYKQNISLPIFVGAIIINTALYFALYKIDFKEVLQGANISASTVSNGYVLKALTMIVTVAALSSNIILIAENGENLLQYKKIEEFSDYSFLNVAMQFSSFVKDNEDDDTDVRYQESIKTEIFHNFLKEDKAAFSIWCLAGEINENYLLVNNNAVELLNMFPEIKSMDKKTKCRILVPSAYGNEQRLLETAPQCLSIAFGNVSENIRYDSKIYNGNEKILCLTSIDTTNFPLRFARFKNPVIVYCDLSSDTLNRLDASSASVDSYFRDIMFKVTDKDIAEIEEKYELEKHHLYLTQEKVTDRFSHYKASLMRIILLNTVISVFLLLLEIAVISTLVKLEYKAHATELSLKKILGYTIYNKCKTLFLLNIYAASIGIVTVVIISLMFRFSLWYVVVLTGAALLAFEWIIIALNIIKLEKTSVPKILKGGSL